MAPVKLKYIVSFSSQDENHRANNLISGDGIKKWLCHPKDRSGKIEIIIQLEQATQFTYIDIGTLWCASLEIRVGHSDWPQNAEYKTLVPMVTLMSPIDCQLGRKPTDTQMFSEKDFSDTTIGKKWDRVQIICRQPYRKDMQSGISFLRIRNSSQGTALSTNDSFTKNEVSQKTGPQQSNKISEIKKHFFGESKENNGDHVDSLKHRLLQISSSSDNGCDNLHQEALSRTAKLVLKASEKSQKSNAHYNLLSKQQGPRGLFSDSVTNRTGMTIEEEMSAFFPTLNLSIVDIDSVTIADLRHKFERQKKRKLSIDEKCKFSSHCQELIGNLIDTNSTAKNFDSITLLPTPADRLSMEGTHRVKNITSQNNNHKETNSKIQPTSKPKTKTTSDSNQKSRLTLKVSPAAILRKKSFIQNENNFSNCDTENPEHNKTAGNNNRKEKKEVDDDSCDTTDSDSLDSGSDICYDDSDDDGKDSVCNLDIDDSSPTRKPQIKRRLQTLEDVNKSYQDLYKTFSPPGTKEHHSQPESPVVKKKKLNSSSKKLIELFDTELSDNEDVQEDKGSTTTGAIAWLRAKKTNNTNTTTPASQSKRKKAATGTPVSQSKRKKTETPALQSKEPSPPRTLVTENEFAISPHCFMPNTMAAKTKNTTPTSQSSQPPPKTLANQNRLSNTTSAHIFLGSSLSTPSSTMIRPENIFSVLHNRNSATRRGGTSANSNKTMANQNEFSISRLSNTTSALTSSHSTALPKRQNMFSVLHNGGSSTPRCGTSNNSNNIVFTTNSRTSTCKHCGFVIPQDTYAAHVAACARPTSTKKTSRPNTSSNQKSATAIDLTDVLWERESAESTLCPICMKEFPKEIITVHASECGL